MAKRWVLKDVGDISFEDVNMSEPGENEVRIRVACAGICSSDIQRVYVTGAHKMPLIPGHEFSGVVEGIGEKVDPKWLEQRVAVFPKIACGKCEHCLNGHTEFCRNYDYIGSRRDGAFAEYVIVPESNLLKLPDEVSLEEAAMLEPHAVAANAMRTGVYGMDTVTATDKPIAVCGMGTIGLMIVSLLKEAGFLRIFAIGNKDSQKERVTKLGIPEENFCDSTKTDPLKWLLDMSNGGVYSYFECVGNNESIRYGMESAMPGGHIVFVGNPHSDMFFPRDVWWKLLRNQISTYGIWNSSFSQNAHEDKTDDWHYVLERIVSGKLHPSDFISHRLKLEDFEKGLHIIKDKTEDYCKVMISVNEP